MEFALNGQKQSVSAADAAKMTLNEYIRFKTIYKGTKLACGQGGCGACTVAVSSKSEDGVVSTRTVPSCLMALTSVSGKSVTTVEGLKKAAVGCHEYSGHPVQERMMQYHGTQCGFCTPGMVMQMWGGLTQHKAAGGKNLSEEEVENLDLLAGNLCRCTGYRPISDCLKSFAKDSTVSFPEAAKGPYETKGNDPKFPEFLAPKPGSEESKGFARPSTLKALKAVWNPDKVVISGHTGWGVYPELYALRPLIGAPSVVQIDAVSELNKIERNGDRLIFGSSVKLNDLAFALEENKGKVSNPVREHILLIAGHQVRNLGSVGGNLMMVKRKGFASDLATILSCADGFVTYLNARKREVSKPLLEFLSSDRDEACLLLKISICLGAEEDGPSMISYRSALRPRNAYSFINAAMLYSVKEGFVTEAGVVYGAVGQHPLYDAALSNTIKGSKVSEVESAVLKLLDTPADIYKHFNDDGHKAYRMRVAQVFALRFARAIDGDKTKPLHGKFTRHTTTSQKWAMPDTPEIKSLAPLFQPKAKTTALAQTTGSSRFTDDEALPALTLHAAYVTIPTASSTFSGLDSTKAKDALGSDLFTVLEAKDLKKLWIPHKEIAFIPSGVPESYENEYVFLPAGEKSQYGSQPVGVVLATSYRLALLGAQLVELKDLKQEGGVNVDPTTAPLAPGTEPIVFHRGDKKKTAQLIQTPPSGTIKIDGVFDKKSQTNFYMEPQSCVAIPDEEGGVTLNLGCQGIALPRPVIAKYLDLPESKVITNTRRLGGSFGGKFTRCIPTGLVASYCATKYGQPVRFVLPREADMAINSGRQEITSKYTVVADSKTGKIKALDFDFNFAQGAVLDCGILHIHMMGGVLDQVYKLDNAIATFKLKHTHNGPATSVRSPGHFEAVMAIETVLDAISGATNIPPERVREANFLPHHKFLGVQGMKGSILPPSLMEGKACVPLWNKLINDIKYWERKAKIDEFNKTNKYRKRGIAITPARYTILRTGNQGARVDVLKDGSIQISTSGIEMGQGLHTKMGQAALGILNKSLGVRVTLDRIKFVQQNSHVYPYGGGTGGSSTSEMCCFAVEEACMNLVPKLKPFLKLAKKFAADKGKSHFDWNDLCLAGYKGNTEMWAAEFTATGFYRPEIKDIFYETYGAAVAEVELDVLTGESKPLYSYIMFDCAPSLNPYVDLGQIEGAYVMGLGQMLLEKRKLCPKTGKLLSTNTWTYKPPTIYDIPEEFHVDMVDLRSQSSNNGWDWMMGAISGIVHGLGLFHKPYRKGHRSIKSSRATGEPPVLFTYCVLGALRQAVIATGRVDGGKLTMPIPATPEVVSDLIWGEDKSLKAIVEEQKENVKGTAVPAGWQPGKVSVGSPIGLLGISSLIGSSVLAVYFSMRYFG